MERNNSIGRAMLEAATAAGGQVATAVHARKKGGGQKRGGTKIPLVSFGPHGLGDQALNMLKRPVKKTTTGEPVKDEAKRGQPSESILALSAAFEFMAPTDPKALGLLGASLVAALG